MRTTKSKMMHRRKKRLSCWETSSSFDYNPATINIYPNPASDILHIYISKSEDSNLRLTAQILSIDGKVMTEIHLNHGSNTIDISSLIAGVYTIKITNRDDLFFVSKFITIK